MENRAWIAIMVASRRGRKPALRLYQRYCGPNVRLFAFCPGDLIWSKRQVIGLGRHKKGWRQRSFPFPRAVYNRCFNKSPTVIARLEDAIGRNRCFNAVNFFSKWQMYATLKPSRIGSYVPDTFLYDKDDLPALLGRYRLMYIKPVYGSMGKSVYRIEWKDSGEVHIAMHSLSANYICSGIEEAQKLLGNHLGTNPHVIQQGIRSYLLGQRHFDIRVLMQKDGSGEWTISNIVVRFAYRHYFNTAVCEAIVDAAEILQLVFSANEISEIAQALEDVSRSAAQSAESTLGLLGELSVDFIVETAKKLWIIELNGKPHKSIYDDLKGSEFQHRIYRRPMEYAHYLSRLGGNETRLPVPALNPAPAAAVPAAPAAAAPAAVSIAPPAVTPAAPVSVAVPSPPPAPPAPQASARIVAKPALHGAPPGRPVPQGRTPSGGGPSQSARPGL